MNTRNRFEPKSEPRTVEDIVRAIEKKSADGDYIFRGESQCHEKVSSSLYRKLKRTGLLGLGVENVQKEELKYAKRYKYTQETDEFKILTEIQHFGGKTNLLDFTVNYRIALFFVCDSFPFKDSRIILQDRNGAIKDWIIEPWDPDPKSRVRVQKSIFVRPPDGFIEPDLEIVIRKDLKQPLLSYLKEKGISRETVYPDLHGFVSGQDTRWHLYEALDAGNRCLESGNKADNSQEKSENYQKAFQHFTRAIDNSIQLDEGLAVAYDGRGSVYLSIGELDNSKGELEKAIEDFTEAIKYKSDYPSAYNNRGRAYFTKGELKNTVADFSKAIELMPRCPEAYHRRGLAYFSKGNFDNAITDLSEAICLNPDDAEAYHRRGIVYLRKEDFNSAIIDLNKAIKMNPNDNLVYYSRGETWLHLKKWDKAKADLTTAKEKGVDIAAVFHNSYKSVEDFEQRIGAELPEDVVVMLTQS